MQRLKKPWGVMRYRGKWAVVRPDGTIRTLRDTVYEAWEQAAQEDYEANQQSGGRRYPVICLSNGRIFMTADYAAESLDLSSNQIKQHIYKQTPYNDLRFDYLLPKTDKQQKTGYAKRPMEIPILAA